MQKDQTGRCLSRWEEEDRPENCRPGSFPPPSLRMSSWLETGGYRQPETELSFAADRFTADGQMGASIIEVATGEVKFCFGSGILSAGALGSCIAVIAFDRELCCGGVAHVMLPGRARNGGDPCRMRYAENALEELFSQFVRFGADPARLHLCLAGAGNVLERPDDTICAGNIASVTSFLQARSLTPCAESLGGVKRRRVCLHLPSGRVECAIGDGPFFLLNNGLAR